MLKFVLKLLSRQIIRSRHQEADFIKEWLQILVANIRIFFVIALKMLNYRFIYHQFTPVSGDSHALFTQNVKYWSQTCRFYHKRHRISDLGIMIECYTHSFHQACTH